MISAISAIATIAAAQASDPPPRDWGQTLRDDVIAAHETIETSHPGMINPDDPDFSRRNDAARDLALERARTADSFADYFYAMQAFTASFDDGHLGYGVYGNTPDLDVRWPGFIARDDGERGLQVTLATDWSGVKPGASLVSCDGKTAFEIGQDRIGNRFGRWELASQRAIRSAFVMVETGNPYVEPIERCIFRDAGGDSEVALDWRDGGAKFYSRYKLFNFPEPDPIGMSWLDDGTAWITLSSFDGNPESERGRSLAALMERLESEAAELRAAPAVILDVRANGGGSASWSNAIARILWGEGAFWRHREPPMTIIFRASEDNIEHFQKTLERRDANGNLLDDQRNYLLRVQQRMRDAIERGDDKYVSEPNLDAGADVDVEALPFFRPAGPVYVLTDYFCMSACLDAVDTWTRFGAIPIGRETGADTVYNEVRMAPMPSGLGAINFPMKLFIGRPRGDNEPIKPRHRYPGIMKDEAALKEWVRNLPR